MELSEKVSRVVVIPNQRYIEILSEKEICVSRKIDKQIENSFWERSDLRSTIKFKKEKKTQHSLYLEFHRSICSELYQSLGVLVAF